MPKLGEKNVFVNGICTWPPAERAPKYFDASASLSTVSEREKPWKLGLPPHWPSDASTDEFPMRRFACITLSPGVGGQPGCGGCGLSLKCISISTCAPTA